MYLLLAAALTLQFCGPGGCPPDAPSSSYRSAHTYTYQPVSIQKYWKEAVDPHTHKRRLVLGFDNPEAGGRFSWWEEDQPERPPTAEIGPAPTLPRPSPQAPVESRFLPDQGVDRLHHQTGKTTIIGSDAEAIREAQAVVNDRKADPPPAKSAARSSIDWPQVIFAGLGGVLALVAIPLVVRRLQT